MKAIVSCCSYRNHAEKVIEEEREKGRKGQPNAKTWRYNLACGMLQLYDHIERQRAIRARYEAAQEAEYEREREASKSDRGSEAA